MKHLLQLKRITVVVVWGLLSIYTISSILSGQISGPYHFRFVDRSEIAVLPFLRAAIVRGDLDLLKFAFPNMVDVMFERVFEQYVVEDNIRAKIDLIADRVSESRDLEMAKGYLSLDEKNYSEARKYFESARSIDPGVFVPQVIDLSN